MGLADNISLTIVAGYQKYLDKGSACSPLDGFEGFRSAIIIFLYKTIY